MKITIYELLGLIKDDKAPKKIKYNNTIYKYSSVDEFYYTDSAWSLYREFPENGNCLNDEVEILEEEKKIPEKLTDILRVDDLIPPVDENMYKIWKQTIKNQNRINEICDYLKSKGDE